MRITGAVKQNILSITVITALLFLFGTSAYAANETLFTTQAPTELSQTDGPNVNYELGTVLQSNIAGQVTAIRFWKDIRETGTHTGRVWSAKGQLLASVIFVNETASGWQQQALAAPLAIAANTSYVVSVNTGKTYYVATTSGLASKVISGNLSTVVGKNGLYGPAATFPTISWHNSNYFRDVVFVAGAGTVTPVPPSAMAPVITTQPASQTITSGRTATFSVAATGTAPMTYQWNNGAGVISGASSSSYTTPAETTNQTFSVTVTNSAGSATSNAAVLTVTTAAVAPTITSQPASQTIMSGQTATFNVAATGSGPMTYQWKNGTATIRGATSSSYTTPAETKGATFTVTVANSMGSATSSAAVLTVNTVAVAPTVTSQPASKSITSGQTATFSVVATGTAPMTYQWMNGTTAISGATSSSYTTPAETSNQTFSVIVTNSAGSATSNAAALTVTAAAVAPTITSQPAGQTITSGQTATFNVAATGTAPMTYQWKNGTTVISGATSSSYTTPAETTNQTFSVTVTNSAGSATSNAAALTVNPAPAVAPTITTQPASKTITSGQTATFSVVATGTAPMTYQWMNGTSAISGATSSSYTTPAETANQTFRVTVTNSAGSATSNAATITVNAGTLILSSSSSALSFGNVNVSSSGTQNVTLTNTGTATVTVSNVSVTGAGFNASGVSSGLMLTPGQTATLTATFTPSGAGSAAGGVAVASNASNSPDTITLSGTGVTAVSHSVDLSWTASTSTVMGYNTYSGTKSGGPYTKLTSAPQAPTTFTDNTVQGGQTYYYVVTSVDSTNTESSYSSEIAATIP